MSKINFEFFVSPVIFEMWFSISGCLGIPLRLDNLVFVNSKVGKMLFSISLSIVAYPPNSAARVFITGK